MEARRRGPGTRSDRSESVVPPPPLRLTRDRAAGADAQASAATFAVIPIFRSRALSLRIVTGGSRKRLLQISLQFMSRRFKLSSGLGLSTPPLPRHIQWSVRGLTTASALRLLSSQYDDN
jgi:hypothetical protein